MNPSQVEALLNDLAAISMTLKDIKEKHGLEKADFDEQGDASKQFGMLEDIVFSKRSISSMKHAIAEHVARKPGQFPIAWYKKRLGVKQGIYKWQIPGLRIEQEGARDKRYVLANTLSALGPELERKERRVQRSELKHSIGLAAKRLLELTPPKAQNEGLRLKMKRLRHSSLVISIDGATTNEHVAELLAAIDGRANVTFVTNDREIEDILLTNRGSHPHRIIFLGGVRREKTGTYVGPESELFFLSLKLIPDISFIGVTGISETGELGSSDLSESRMKRMLLGAPHVTLQCACLDSKKIKERSASAWTFATLQSIDMVISDPAAESDPEFVRQLFEAETLLVTERSFASVTAGGPVSS